MTVFKDIDLTFKRHPQSGDVVTRSDARAVLQAVREIVMTTAGEWDAFREMGAGANRLLGENADPVAMANMKLKIEENVRQFEPRADVKNVTVTQMTNNLNAITIKVSFFTMNVPELQELAVPLERLR